LGERERFSKVFNGIAGHSMTLTKADIVKRVREKVRFKNKRKSQQIFLFPEMDCIFLSKSRATDIVNSLFESIKKTLATGEDVCIYRFGKFQTKFRWARKGRNPRTGKTIVLPSSRTVKFRASPKLREKINAIDKDK
jgi:nucleoid DNA-binding protein